MTSTPVALVGDSVRRASVKLRRGTDSVCTLTAHQIYPNKAIETVKMQLYGKQVLRTHSRSQTLPFSVVEMEADASSR